MWKVVIVICALGNPCVIMEESPMKHYEDKDKCMEVAFQKHNELLDAFENYGYSIYSSEYNCEKVNQQTSYL
jgi:hypothetical protein|tara:strand:- start:1511 stop:1726 length:216 start_codon:yes stop_codon:yes gene_type:complete